ncbi:heavy metal translocating P-type ATPase [Microbacterium rhizomatis]|uniref:heavy metal translocating P-type ATPase n=1 Tax=Microbacterium rhizomatis TaxID=1631477 RepID=UPI001FE9DF1C|nr:heavy metal translocating P-type ATPase [Microbacterium rhizomatis]
MAATLVVGFAALLLTLSPWSPAGQWLLVAYVVLMAARSAWAMVHDLVKGSFGVDVIAVTAIAAAVLVGEEWAALVIVLMLTTGEALEAYAAARARRDLSALLARNPQTALRIQPSGDIEPVAVAALSPGDRILVRADEMIPVDGTLLDSPGVLDESSLTGESLPVEKEPGDEVLSGAMNGRTAITLLVVRRADQSQYQQIVALVEDAAATKAPIVRLADRFALPFAIAAYVIAGAAWWMSGDPARFAEVLVVATPCPLIIAAPVAFIAGMSRAARHGIIIRTSATLEELHRVRTFAFDKTGTLTKGTPALVGVQPAAPFTEDTVLGLAAAVEANSSHALAASTVAGARERGLILTPATNASETTASGITGTVGGARVSVGKRDYVAEHVESGIPDLRPRPGEMATYVAVDGRFAGMLVFEDRVRDEARATLDRLRSSGVRTVVMLTGDTSPTAEHIAADLDIRDVHANCLPADKVSIVQHIAGRPVAMVGDGVNDAPVLAAADIGIAMGARGATAASEAAGAVILRDDLSCVADAVQIAQRTIRIGLESIWIGIALSLALMGVAAFGLVPALLGAWLQEGVDVIAIVWALRATRER